MIPTTTLKTILFAASAAVGMFFCCIFLGKAANWLLPEISDQVRAGIYVFSLLVGLVAAAVVGGITGYLFHNSEEAKIARVRVAQDAKDEELRKEMIRAKEREELSKTLQGQLPAHDPTSGEVTAQIPIVMSSGGFSKRKS